MLSLKTLQPYDTYSSFSIRSEEHLEFRDSCGKSRLHDVGAGALSPDILELDILISTCTEPLKDPIGALIDP